MPPNASGCRRCGTVLEQDALSVVCSSCIIRGYLVDGEEGLLADFTGLGPAPIAQWLHRNADEAFRQLHDAARARRLQVTGLPQHQFTEQLAQAIDSVVARRGGSLEDSERAAARLLAASVGRLNAVLGHWSLLPELSAEERKAAVAGFADGRFDAVRGIDPARLLGLAAQPWCSHAGGGTQRQWISAAAAEAVRSGLARLTGGGPSAIAQLNACLVHAAACIGDEDDFELEDLAGAAGVTLDHLKAMRAEVAGQAKPVRLLQPGAGRRDPKTLDEHAAFRRARTWLGFNLDLHALDGIDQLNAELPGIVDPWVRWAYATAMQGPTWERMLSILLQLGAGRKVRESVLAEARRSGLLAGKPAEAVFEQETAAVSGGGYELRVFRNLFELELKGKPTPSGVGGVASWYDRARAAYFADAAAIGSLAPVRPMLRELRGQPGLPPWLEDLVSGLADFEWSEMLGQAEAMGRGWLVRIVEQVMPGREDPRVAERVRSLLSADDQNLLRELARRAAPGGNPPWFGIKLDAGAEFRLKEAAFASGFIGEPAFKEAIVSHSRPLWDNRDASPDECRTLKALCERCGRSMLGRLRDAEPRSRTLDAFRRSNWRGMLEAECVESSGLPNQAVPMGVVGVSAACAWALALVLACFLAIVLLLGGSTVAPVVMGAAPAQVSPPWQSPELDLTKAGWKRVSDVSGQSAWARRVPAAELRSLLPAGTDAADGRVSRGEALEFVRRFQARLIGPSGDPRGLVRCEVDSRTITWDAEKVIVSLPASTAEMASMATADEAWIDDGASAPFDTGIRRSVIVKVGIPQVDSR